METQEFKKPCYERGHDKSKIWMQINWLNNLGSVNIGNSIRFQFLFTWISIFLSFLIPETLMPQLLFIIEFLNEKKCVLYIITNRKLICMQQQYPICFVHFFLYKHSPLIPFFQLIIILMVDLILPMFINRVRALGNCPNEFKLNSCLILAGEI